MILHLKKAAKLGKFLLRLKIRLAIISEEFNLILEAATKLHNFMKQQVRV